MADVATAPATTPTTPASAVPAAASSPEPVAAEASENNSSEADSSEQANDEVAGGEYDVEDPFEEPSPEEASTPADESSGEQVEEKATESKPEPAAPAVNNLLTIRAIRAGFSDEEIASFKDPQALHTALRRIEALQEKAKPAEQAKKEEEPEFELKLSEDLDPEFKKQLTGMHADYKKRVGGLQQKLDAALGYIDEQRQEVLQQKLDGLFDGAGDEYKGLIGKGGTRSLDTKGSEFQNRLKVVHEMHILETGYRHAGSQVPEMKELYAKAMRNVFGEQAKAAVKKELSAQLTKHSKQILTRPNNKAPAQKPLGTSRAIDTVRKYLAEHPTEDDEA